MILSIQVTKDKNGVVAPAVFKFDDMETAKANYHYFLSSAYGNTDLVYFMADIISEAGESVMRESYYAPVIEVEAHEEISEE